MGDTKKVQKSIDRLERQLARANHAEWMCNSEHEAEQRNDLDIASYSFVGEQRVHFNDLAKLAPVPVTLRKLGELHAPPTATGSSNNKMIEVAITGNEAEEISVLFHEWTHVELRHYNDNKKFVDMVSDHYGGMSMIVELVLATSQEFDTLRRGHELLAESTSYVLCDYFGIASPRKYGYLAGYGISDANIKDFAGDISDAALKIINKIEAAHLVQAA